MSLSPEKMREMTELSMLEPDDLQRTRFVAILKSATEEEREFWSGLEQENRVLQTLIGGTTGTPKLPNLLEASLLAIPTDLPKPVKSSWKDASIPWPVAAGIIFAILGLGWYLYQAGDRPSVQVATYPAAPKEAIDKVKSIAVEDHLSSIKLDVKDDNPAAVVAALVAENGGRIQFGIAMPSVATNCHLQGGSILPFGKGWAVYTRWEQQGAVFSLYQFLPENVSLPHQFEREMGIPVAATAKSKGAFASVWFAPPDGKTTWATVWDSSAFSEPFSGCGD